MPFDLRNLPSEVRVLIFSHSSILKKTRWARSSPSLLIALRAEPVLYAEALEVFYAINTFNLDHNNDWSFHNTLSSRSIADVKRIHVRFWLQNGLDSETVVPSSKELDGKGIREAQAVKSLALEFNFKVQGREDNVVTIVEWCVGYFPQLEELTICICHTSSADGAPDLLKRVGKALDATIMSSGEDAKGYVVFKWVAGRGRKILWV